MSSLKFRVPLRYRVLGWLLFPIVVAHLVWRAIKDGGTSYLQQRLGFSRASTSTESTLWFHAASVGEINTLAPLLHQVRRQYPYAPLLVTTNTPTGKQAFERIDIDNANHCYLPLDYKFCVTRFTHRHPAAVGIIAETEIWPMLYQLVDHPLIIINGRLSDRTLRFASGFFASTYRAAMSRLTHVLARSENDAAGFIKLGLPQSVVQVTGNLKFAGPSDLPAGYPRLVEPDYCLLASTHDDEELQIAREWFNQGRTELLVIAPRHPERRKAILNQLEDVTPHIVVRSEGQQPAQDTRIYLADTFGEMQSWYQHASAIFMGGSLGSTGGHNLLEPARVGQSVVTGPNTANFADEMRAMIEGDGVTEAANAVAVVAALISMLNSPALANRLGNNAKRVVQQNDRIDASYLDALSPWIDNRPAVSPNSGD